MAGNILMMIELCNHCKRFDMEDALKSISEKEINQFFQRLINTHIETMDGTLDKDQLTLLQERVKVYKEMREQFVSIRNS